MGTESSDDVAALLPLSDAVFHILVALADGESHGYAIMQEVASLTDGRIRLSPGTLYGAIQRMTEQGLISEVTGRRVDDRRRAYRTTAFGRRVATAETERLRRLVLNARHAGFAPKRA